MGRLTKDPEVRYSQGEKSTAIARYTLAVDRKFKRDGEPNADFINCIAFGKNGEFAESKGANQSERPQPMPQTDSGGFMSIPDGIDEELPFS